MASWWLNQLNAKGLSQGDVVRILVSGTAAVPHKALRSRSLKGGKQGWEEVAWTPDHNGFGYYLAVGKRLPVLVVSHSCELDKPKNPEKPRPVHVAPMMPLSRFNEGDREAVLQQTNIHLFPLLGVAELEDHCADLRCISYLDRKLVDGAERVASMSEEELKNLQAHLVAFFTRLRVPQAQFTPEA